MTAQNWSLFGLAQGKLFFSTTRDLRTIGFSYVAGIAALKLSSLRFTDVPSTFLSVSESTALVLNVRMLVVYRDSAQSLPGHVGQLSRSLLN